MNVGIVVETDRDGAAYPELIRKIRNDVGIVIVFPCRGVTKLKHKFVGWLKHCQWGTEHPVDKALVIMDSNCANPATWEEQLKEIYRRSRFTPGFPVRFHATKCEIETWLLADENAINEVARSRGKHGSIPALTIQLESHRDAKELFRKVLSKVRLPADPKVYQEIASAASIDRIAAHCPHFQQFVDKVRAC